VLNDTRVIHARLLGRKESGGRVEVLLLKEDSPGMWSCLVKASKAPREECVLLFDDGLSALVKGREDDVFFLGFAEPERVLGTGRLPLPPYIERAPEQCDEEAYQTVYAINEGSVAAPTAGLHFTKEFLDRLRGNGVGTVFVTLHVGPGTFMPVRTENLEDHVMHEEDYTVSPEAAETINRSRRAGKRIVAVGTTTTRVLEHLTGEHGEIVPGKGSTRLFIRNGYSFRCTDALLTNFHLPCSTLLMLVAAFGGYENTMKAYRAAIEERYRFFSYGDAMLII
jgi:S-adenosylmethionine:tRNA ribosyltransferase-isomerase